MKFTTQIYRRTDPDNLHPIVVEFVRLYSIGMPATRFEFEISAKTDTDADGVPDVDLEISRVDFTRKYDANATQLGIVSDRLCGGGNLMAGIRTFCKNKVDEHNAEVNPGGTAATHTDIDTDTYTG